MRTDSEVLCFPLIHVRFLLKNVLQVSGDLESTYFYTPPWTVFNTNNHFPFRPNRRESIYPHDDGLFFQWPWETINLHLLNRAFKEESCIIARFLFRHKYRQKRAKWLWLVHWCPFTQMQCQANEFVFICVLFKTCHFSFKKRAQISNYLKTSILNVRLRACRMRMQHFSLM